MIRDARTDPPPLDEPVLVWDGSFWAPAWRPSRQPEAFVFSDADFGCGPIGRAPYWLPMPPPPPDVWIPLERA